MKTLLLLITLVSLSSAAEITLSWDANPETDIASYTLHVGTRSGVYDRKITVTGIEKLVNDLQPGTTYFFAVFATNTSGLSGPLSDEISYVIPPVQPVAPVKTKGLKVMPILSSIDMIKWELDGYYIARTNSDGTYPPKKFYKIPELIETPIN